MGGWGPSRGRQRRGGVKWIKQRKNGVLFDNQRMLWGLGCGGGKATAAADYLTMGELKGWGGDWG